MRILRVAATLAGLCVILGAANPPLSLGGVVIGTSVLDVVKKLGMPDIVQTTDDGHLWQWSEAGGLDREIVTDDDLAIESILVASARAASTAQPAEIPVLGDPVDSAMSIVAAAGAVPAKHAPTWRSWRFNGGVLVVETNASIVTGLRALDERAAAIRGVFGPKPVVAAHRAPALMKEYTPAQLPPSGAAVVRVDIDAQGKVTDARVIVPSGDAAVDRFVIESMTHSTFAPATCGGTPCAGVYMEISGMSR